MANIVVFLFCKNIEETEKAVVLWHNGF